MSEFQYEDITVDDKFPTFRVWATGSWELEFLGVIRDTTNSVARKRFPDSPLKWTAALGSEADPATWQDKHTRSTRTREEAAMWLQGCRDAVTNPRIDGAKAMLKQNHLFSTAYNVCPSCEGTVSATSIHVNETKCESCDVELWRSEMDRTPFHKPLWKLRSA